MQLVAIWEGDRLRAELETLLAGAMTVPNATITVAAPGRKRSGPTPLLESSAGEFLPEWKLGLSLSGTDPFAEEAARRTELHLWGGILVIGAIAALAGFVAHYVSGQLQITRLKENLISVVSHELKTPVAATRALAESLLEGRCRDAAQQREYLQLILQENERLCRLIQDFLAFSRMEQNKQAFQLEEVSVETIITAAVDAERVKLQSPGCVLTVDVEPDLPSVAGDAEALTTVLINLLDNAYKYGGAEKKIQLRAYAANGQVVFAVQDNGAGLLRRESKKIFAPFFQLHRDDAETVGGCGLGLSIVQFVARAHRGSVEVDSQPGRGSRFTVLLPAIPTKTHPQTDLPSHAETSATNV
jgi:signal transduction histidine kinase